MAVGCVQVDVDRRSVVKLRVTNTGQRAAFAKVSSSAGAHKSIHMHVYVLVCVCMYVSTLCVHSYFPVGGTEAILPVDKLSVSPSELVLLPQQTKASVSYMYTWLCSPGLLTCNYGWVCMNLVYVLCSE